QTMIKGQAQAEHFARLHDELSVLPCSPRCANWLLYGIQPKNAKPGLTPGACKSKVHQPATLGYTGRRCLISRNWSNKTLTDHRLDGQEWFRAVTNGLLGDDSTADGHDDRRYYYELAGAHDLDVPNQQERIFRSIAARLKARQAIQAARNRERGTGLPAIQPEQGVRRDGTEECAAG
ncbi:MAG TPA: replication initiator, partial [Jiangellales bacterium]|nr:replication initiator [Jiangellales bacterium]